MLLVRPDMVRDSSVTTPTVTPPLSNTQKEYYETQMLKEKVSPHSSLIQALTRLHNKAYAVLQDDAIEGSVKLARYNQLMTTSSILMKKVKNYMKWDEVDILPHYPTALTHDTSSSISDSTQGEYSWRDDDSELTDVSDLQDLDEESDTSHTSQLMAHRSVPSPLRSKSTVSGLEDEIKRRVPVSYQNTARNLYKTLLKSGKGKVNWNASGQLVLGGQHIPGSDIVELLSDAARTRTKGIPPTGRAQFIKVMKRLNPALKYIRNKKPYSAKQSDKKSHTQAQSGKGVRQKIVWHTRL